MLSPDSISTAASLGEAFIKILTPLIITLGGVAMAHLTAWIKSKTHNTTITGALDVLKDVVAATVQELEQTTVKALRDNNGRLDGKVADTVKASALQKLKMLYGPEGLKDLAKRLGVSDDGVLRLIGTLIEQAVFSLKNGVPASLPPPATDPPFDPNVFGAMTPEEKVDQQLREQADKAAAPDHAPMTSKAFP